MRQYLRAHLWATKGREIDISRPGSTACLGQSGSYRLRRLLPRTCFAVILGKAEEMKSYAAVVERDAVTGLLIGYVPGFPGAHSQAESLDELNANLREVIAMLLEDGAPRMDAEFVGLQNIAVV